jgi:hypothetical protein
MTRDFIFAAGAIVLWEASKRHPISAIVGAVCVAAALNFFGVP